MKLHRKIKHNEKVCRAHDLGSYAQGQGRSQVRGQNRVSAITQKEVYFWGFYDIKFKLTQYKSKLGLIPQYTFDLRKFDITNLKFGSNTTIYLSQHVTLTHYKPKPGLIPQHTKQTTLYYPSTNPEQD